MDFELGTGPREDFADKRAHLSLDQVQHDAAHAFVGIVNMFGDLDSAVLANGQDAVIVQQGLGAGLLVRLDDVLEQHPVLNLGRDGLGETRMGDVHLAFNGREDADVDLIFCRRGVRPYSGRQKQ
jgi:hypothetical protein